MVLVASPVSAAGLTEDRDVPVESPRGGILRSLETERPVRRVVPGPAPDARGLAPRSDKVEDQEARALEPAQDSRRCAARELAETGGVYVCEVAPVGRWPTRGRWPALRARWLIPRRRARGDATDQGGQGRRVKPMLV